MYTSTSPNFEPPEFGPGTALPLRAAAIGYRAFLGLTACMQLEAGATGCTNWEFLPDVQNWAIRSALNPLLSSATLGQLVQPNKRNKPVHEPPQTAVLILKIL